jgi:polysaccharide export outer membrane protein
LLIISDSAGTHYSHRFSLLDQSLFSKSFYFLKPNDVIYVQANNVKGINTGIIPTILPLALSALSLLVIISNQIK